MSPNLTHLSRALAIRGEITMRKPYAFPLRSRAAMSAYILDRKAYHDHYTPFPFSWNVKAYHVDYDKPKGEPLDSSLDAEWSKLMRKNDSYYANALEDAQREYADGEYTTYPGNDQGDWRFGFYGRSAGHLCLETWLGRKMHGRDFDLTEYVTELSFADVRTLYKALVCMDQDFTPHEANKNVEYHLNFQRTLWEEERHAEIEQRARCLEASRPDLYAE